MVDCEELSAPVYVDSEMWEKIVLNLVSNAFKYTHQGSVTVTLGEEARSAQLTVADTGIGIPPAELPHIFDRFHRVEGARGRTHEGTGIGLALVRELVQLHGGSTYVKSEAGVGSEFTVRIPFGYAHLPQDQVRDRQTLNSTGSHATAFVEEALRWLPESADRVVQVSRDSYPVSVRKRENIRNTILVADDNADMREYIARLLKPHYNVTSVSSGDEALALAITNPPNLVLTDVMMPGLDGFGLLGELRGTRENKNPSDHPALRTCGRRFAVSKVSRPELTITLPNLYSPRTKGSSRCASFASAYEEGGRSSPPAERGETWPGSESTRNPELGMGPEEQRILE